MNLFPASSLASYACRSSLSSPFSFLSSFLLIPPLVLSNLIHKDAKLLVSFLSEPLSLLLRKCSRAADRSDVRLRGREDAMNVTNASRKGHPHAREVGRERGKKRREKERSEHQGRAEQRVRDGDSGVFNQSFVQKITW